MLFYVVTGNSCVLFIMHRMYKSNDDKFEAQCLFQDVTLQIVIFVNRILAKVSPPLKIFSKVAVGLFLDWWQHL